MSHVVTVDSRKAGASSSDAVSDESLPFDRNAVSVNVMRDRMWPMAENCHA